MIMPQLGSQALGELLKRNPHLSNFAAPLLAPQTLPDRVKAMVREYPAATLADVVDMCKRIRLGLPTDLGDTAALADAMLATIDPDQAPATYRLAQFIERFGWEGLISAGTLDRTAVVAMRTAHEGSATSSLKRALAARLGFPGAYQRDERIQDGFSMPGLSLLTTAAVLDLFAQTVKAREAAEGAEA